MALVICRVFFTLRMRRRRSSTFAIRPYAVALLRIYRCLGFLAAGKEVLLVLVDRIGQALAKSSSSAFFLVMSARMSGCAESRNG